jgi:flavin reductase (DIM6/NTAB) family NADH-FMN oxidoreductase RutF
MDTEKVEIASEMAYRLLHPRHTVLVSCIDKKGKANIITLAWTMPTSIKPPMVVLSIAPNRYSHQIIEEKGEFVVNIPTMEISKQSLFCGRISGRRVDKFKEAKLTPIPAKKINSPIIKECVAHLECKIVQKIITGDHTLFVGEVVAAYVNKGLFTNTYNAEKVKPIFHIGGNDFTTISSEVVSLHARKVHY